MTSTRSGVRLCVLPSAADGEDHEFRTACPRPGLRSNCPGRMRRVRALSHLSCVPATCRGGATRIRVYRHLRRFRLGMGTRWRIWLWPRRRLRTWWRAWWWTRPRRWASMSPAVPMVCPIPSGRLACHARPVSKARRQLSRHDHHRGDLSMALNLANAPWGCVRQSSGCLRTEGQGRHA